MEYKGLIFTNHILQRMQQRGIDFHDIYWAWAKPDDTLKAETPGALKFYRNYDNKKIAVVAKKNEDGKWLVLTCWQKEVFSRRKKSSINSGLTFWQNLWKMIRG